jgi:hypothetical protein
MNRQPTAGLIRTGLATAALVAGLSVGANYALAGFEIVDRPPKPIGGTGEDEALVEGFGKDLPLDLVVAQVVPPRFQVVFEFDVDRTATTSWAGGRPWRDVLTESLAPLGLSFVEDGQGGLMVVRAAPRVATPEEQAMAVQGQGAMDGPEEVPTWTALGGSTLRQTLDEWSGQSGWVIAWESELDYPLKASAEFYGDFKTAASNLIRAFSRAEPPVRATVFNGNRVIVVTSGADREE